MDIQDKDDDLSALRNRVTQLEAFARDLIKRWDWSGDIDGGDFQDCALHHGVLKAVQMEAPCGDEYECNCLSYYCPDEWPVTCYRSTLPEVGGDA